MAGDGDFLMTGQDFATAVQYKLPLIVLIYDNGLYGTIRMHQEREYPGRVIATQLHNPDFVAYARAFGGFGVKVEKTADFPAAFEAARQSGKPSIIQLKVDPEALTPGLSLTQIREKALAGGGGSPARIGVEGLRSTQIYYSTGMTKLLDDVIDRVRAWPAERQDEAAQLLLELEAQRTSHYRLTPEQVEEVRRIREQLRDGTMAFATDEQMDAFWKKCGL